MKIVICQCNSVVGDVQGNARRICDIVSSVAGDASIGASSGAPDLVVFPELFIQGYPPYDLLEQRWFINHGLEALEKVRACSQKYPGTGILVGMAMPNDCAFGKGLHNSAVLICDGEIVFSQHKSLLPTYDVFDEARYFDPAGSIDVVPFKGERLGISICEDAWAHEALRTRRLYDLDPVDDLARRGATLFINISASPFHMGKGNLRAAIVKKHATRHKKPFVYLNLVGGNDELIFDGNSMVIDGEGNLRALLPSFSEAIVAIDTCAPGPVIPLPDFDTLSSVHDALVLGIRDYAGKCGFSKALIGLSGGIDSALTCACAVHALGPGNVWGVAMPSMVSSEGSVADAEKLAKNCGIKFSIIPIKKVFQSLSETLAGEFAGTEPGIAEENLQARARGTLLMALSNKFGHLLLTTGNKSETAVGYCTLYGDMSGGLGVISDLPKDMVYKLSRYINSVAGKEIIPATTLTKPPSAELRPNQTDQDTLPPYPVLDGILEGLVEKGLSQEELAERGFDRETLAWVCKAIRGSEYKRRQAAPGLKVTPKAFGIGRRFPIAAKYDW
jgi:NAD+ synthase (glutamine-hydrolysing)